MLQLVLSKCFLPLSIACLAQNLACLLALRRKNFHRLAANRGILCVLGSFSYRYIRLYGSAAEPSCLHGLNLLSSHPSLMWNRTRANRAKANVPSVLVRFDILCVVRDVVDPIQDERLAKFVVGSHAASHPDEMAAAAEAEEEGEGRQQQQQQQQGILSQDMLRKYITYAKQNCRPVFGEVSACSQTLSDS